nr:SAM-dependent methyltransferase [Angustibacter aerolatus]
MLKLGRTFETVRGAVEDAGRGPAAWYVERASTQQQRTAALRDVDPGEVPYFALAMVSSPAVAARAGQVTAQPVESPAPPATAVGEVVVVGLGPGGEQWLTPEAAAALRAADHLVGYRTYLDRVPAGLTRHEQVRHASGNTVEADRADLALEPGPAGAPRRRGLRRRPRGLRDGRRGGRAGGGRALARRAGAGAARRHRGAGRRQQGGRTARARPRGGLAERPVEALGRRHGPARRAGRGRPGDRDLQPALAGPALAAGGGAGGAAALPRPCDAGGGGPRRGWPGGVGAGGAARRARPGDGRHALPAAGRVLAHGPDAGRPGGHPRWYPDEPEERQQEQQAAGRSVD